jgi:GNAT superfamily N-acetyltransferase
MSTPAKQFECEIRRAQPEDYAQMGELSQQLGYAAGANEIAARIAPMRESGEHDVFVAQTASGGIAGWIGVFVYHTVEADARVEVSGLVVDAGVRSQGIGRRLLERAEQWAREKGLRAIGLRTNVTRERAHAFYDRQGYEHNKTQRSYRKAL